MTSLPAITHKLRVAGLNAAADGLEIAAGAVDTEGDFIGSVRHLNAVLAVCQRVYRDALDAALVPPAIVPAIRPPEPVRMRSGEPEPPEAA